MIIRPLLRIAQLGPPGHLLADEPVLGGEAGSRRTDPCRTGGRTRRRTSATCRSGPSAGRPRPGRCCGSSRRGRACVNLGVQPSRFLPVEQLDPLRCRDFGNTGRLLCRQPRHGDQRGAKRQNGNEQRQGAARRVDTRSQHARDDSPSRLACHLALGRSGCPTVAARAVSRSKYMFSRSTHMYFAIST